MFNADHVKQDPHGSAFSCLCSASSTAPGILRSPTIPKRWPACKLGERPQVIVGLTPQPHAHVVPRMRMAYPKTPLSIPLSSMSMSAAAGRLDTGMVIMLPKMATMNPAGIQSNSPTGR